MPGQLEVIHGCMFAGKTAALIDRLLGAAAAGRRTAAFKHVLDRRYDAEHLVTHDGRQMLARSVTDALELESVILAAEVDLVGIDETQFFGRSLIPVCDGLIARGTDMVLAGIDHDVWGRPFAPVPELAARAARVTLLTTPCGHCGAPARFSQRITPLVDGEFVGGPEAYSPRCSACFIPLSEPALAAR